MRVVEAEAKTLLIRRRRVDSWFMSALGMNLYRGCSHDCAYCDGRAEQYHVSGEFGCEVVAKTNAPALLRRELDSRRRRVPLRRSYVAIGGGVGDSYQPAEARYALTRQALEILAEHARPRESGCPSEGGWPVHVLTKSSLVERDFDVLARIQERSGVILSMSFSSVRDDVAAVFEPGCTWPTRRLETLVRAKARGFATGAYLMPVVPFVTDPAEVIDETVGRLAAAGVDFVMFGGMTLQQGRQREHFLEVLGRERPELVARVARMYGSDPWGAPDLRHAEPIEPRFDAASRRHGVARRMPTRLFRDVLGENDFVAVLLEGLDYLRRLGGRRSFLWRAARTIAEHPRPISEDRAQLSRLPGLAGEPARIVDEILATGSAAEYEQRITGAP
jgi:DNA repair photolyase